MLRFLLSILILWAFVWGIFSFFNPLNQLAKGFEKTPDEYTALLTQAIERNNPEAWDVSAMFGNKNLEEKDDTESTEQEDIDNNKNLGNRAFIQNEFYSQDSSANSWGWEDTMNSKTRSYPLNDIEQWMNRAEKNLRNLYGKTQGTGWYFGTPPLPNSNTKKGSSQLWGLIFDPPLSPPPLSSGAGGNMMFGKYTNIRDYGAYWKL